MKLLPMLNLCHLFIEWVEDAASRFAVPICIVGQHDESIELSFIGITQALTASLIDGELNVYADWEGENWDTILWLDACPNETSSGFVCSECDPGSRESYPTEEAFWRGHLFEPFLEWVNTKLAASDVLCLYGAPGRVTWAKLETENGCFYWDEATFRIPLRV